MTELDTTGGNALDSTFCDGKKEDYGMGTGLDAAEDVFVVGQTGTGFPTAPRAYLWAGLPAQAEAVAARSGEPYRSRH